MAINKSYHYLNLLFGADCTAHLSDALLPPSSHPERCQFAGSLAVSGVWSLRGTLLSVI